MYHCLSYLYIIFIPKCLFLVVTSPCTSLVFTTGYCTILPCVPQILENQSAPNLNVCSFPSNSFLSFPSPSDCTINHPAVQVKVFRCYFLILFLLIFIFSENLFVCSQFHLCFISCIQRFPSNMDIITVLFRP